MDRNLEFSIGVEYIITFGSESKEFTFKGHLHKVEGIAKSPNLRRLFFEITDPGNCNMGKGALCQMKSSQIDTIKPVPLIDPDEVLLNMLKSQLRS